MDSLRIAHCADLHLGLYRHDRTTPEGINQRTADIALQLERMIDALISSAPDVLLVAGDVFHQPNPKPPVLIHAFAQFKRLLDSLPDLIVIMVAGNHDISRSGEECILNLFRQLGIVVVDKRPEAWSFTHLGLNVMCVPEVKSLDTELKPDPDFRYNVLLVHGEVRGLIKGSDAKMTYEADELVAGGWSYVALGHFHTQHMVASRVWYAGSPDFTSNDVWHETGDKGFLEVDLADDDLEIVHRVLKAPRPHVNIELDGAGLSVEELNDRISAACYAENVVDKVVRVVLLNVDNTTKRAIDPKMIRELRALATHFAIEARPPQTERELIVGIQPKVTSLESELRAKLETIQITDNIPRPQFIERGLKYFERTNSEAA